MNGSYGAEEITLFASMETKNERQKGNLSGLRERGRVKRIPFAYLDRNEENMFSLLSFSYCESIPFINSQILSIGCTAYCNEI